MKVRLGDALFIIGISMLIIFHFKLISERVVFEQRRSAFCAAVKYIDTPDHLKMIYDAKLCTP
jgi:hypothetical protein